VPKLNLGENQVRAAQHQMSAAWAWIALVIGGVSVAVALWFTIGPWSVSVGGVSQPCIGSPFMGRYRSVSDPFATTAVACQLQAANRMHTAEVAWLIGLVFVPLGIVLLRRARRRSEGSAAP
jgi:hypothetical protein